MDQSFIEHMQELCIKYERKSRGNDVVRVVTESKEEPYGE
jgi:hypothetical protein